MAKQNIKIDRSVIEVWLASKKWSSREQGIAAFLALSRRERRAYESKCRKLGKRLKRMNAAPPDKAAASAVVEVS